MYFYSQKSENCVGLWCSFREIVTNGVNCKPAINIICLVSLLICIQTLLLTADEEAIYKQEKMATSIENTRWQCGLTLSGGLSELRKREIMTDVTFVVGASPPMKVFAHKLVLSARSPVFCAMFDGPLAESAEIEIPDIDGDAFNMMLRFMYEESTTVTIENVQKILYAAEKYDLEKLKMKCDEFLTQNIDNCSNVLQTLELSQQYQLPNLTEKALKCVGIKPAEYLESTEFTALSQQCVKTLFDYDKHSTAEINFYKAALHWADAECSRKSLTSSDANKREVLGPILYSIRFPLLGSDLFCKEVVDSEILMLQEKVDVFKHFSNNQSELSPFISKPRLFEFTRVKRFDIYVDQTHILNSPSIQAISFSVQKPAFIRGILVHSCNGLSTYTASLKNDNNTISDVKGHTYHTGDPPITELHFPDIVELKPGNTYSIVLNFTLGCIYGYSNQGGKTTVEFGHNIATFTNCASSQYTNITYGLIPGLLLSTL